MLNNGFCFCADNHIDVRGFRAEIPAEDTLYPLEQVVRYCIDNRKPLVLGGDLTDKSLPPSRLLNRIVEILSDLARAEIPCFAIQGNHDKDPEFPWACHAPGVHHLGLTPVDVGGYQLCGIDFQPAGLINTLLSQVPVCDGLIIHQALKQGLGFENAWNCDLDWVNPDRVRNVYVGDLHKVLHELWGSGNRVRALYSGSQYMTTVDESSSPTFIDVGPRTREQHHEYARIPLLHRPVHRYQIRSEADLVAAIEDAAAKLASPDGRLPEALRPPVFVVQYPVDLPTAQPAFKDLCAGGVAILVEQPQPPVNADASSIRRISIQAEQGLTLATLVDRKVPPSSSPELNAFLHELVRSKSNDDIKQTITGWRARILAA